MEMTDNAKVAKEPSVCASVSSTAIPSASASGYSYRPLLSERKEIRVLRFETSLSISPSSRLRLKVQTVSLSDAEHEPYYCISYAWGENPGRAPVFLDDREVQIPGSAEEALRGVLCHISKERQLQYTLIWIDAVCINQDDLKEKSQQVAFMGEVYAQAHLVFAWLGPDDGTAKAATEGFKALQQQCRNLTDESHGLEFLKDLSMDERSAWPCLLAPPPSDCSIQAFSSFINCRYFTRYWILQEIAVARIVVVIRGEQEILWGDLAEAILWIDVHRVYWFVRSGNWADEARISAIKVLIDARHSTSDDGKSDTLFHDVLVISFLFKTSNAWDKVYAILDVSFRHMVSSEGSATTRIVPNYEKPLRSVYQEASWIAMKQANSAKLSRMAATFAPLFEDLPNWPSWVPRYHDMRFTDFTSVSIGPSNTRASHDVQSKFHLDAGNQDILHVQGLLVGAVADFLPLGACSDGVLLRWLANVWPEEGDGVLLKRTAAALVAGLYQGFNAEGSESILSDFVAFILEKKEDCDTWTRLALERITAAVADNEGDAALFSGQRLPGERTLFQTEDGRLGNTFAKVSTNDHICVLFGCDDLFVLRHTNGNWKIKGLAYVPGTAQGEYVQQLQGEGRLEQETVTFGIC